MDDESIEKARRMTGVQKKTALVRAGLRPVRRREAERIAKGEES